MLFLVCFQGTLNNLPEPWLSSLVCPNLRFFWRRIRRLEKSGVIKGHRLVLDREKLGFGVTVFLGIKLSGKKGGQLEDFERAVSAIPEVQTVQHVLGMYDYRLRVVARDIVVLSVYCGGVL